MLRGYLLIIILGMFTSCDTQIFLEAKNTEKIVYNFHDSSVPPQYHRSFEITVTKTSANIIVDSYGDTLATASKELAEGEFEEFVSVINDAKLTNSKPKNDLACSGSTAESLKIYTDKLLLNTYLDHCKNNEFPSSSGQIRIVVDKMKLFFPDLDELLK